MKDLREITKTMSSTESLRTRMYRLESMTWGIYNDLFSSSYVRFGKLMKVIFLLQVSHLCRYVCTRKICVSFVYHSCIEGVGLHFCINKVRWIVSWAEHFFQWAISVCLFPHICQYLLRWDRKVFLVVWRPIDIGCPCFFGKNGDNRAIELELLSTWFWNLICFDMDLSCGCSVWCFWVGCVVLYHFCLCFCWWFIYVN